MGEAITTCHHKSCESGGPRAAPAGGSRSDKSHHVKCYCQVPFVALGLRCFIFRKSHHFWSPQTHARVPHTSYKLGWPWAALLSASRRDKSQVYCMPIVMLAETPWVDLAGAGCRHSWHAYMSPCCLFLGPVGCISLPGCGS